jgi:hypothetical protein
MSLITAKSVVFENAGFSVATVSRLMSTFQITRINSRLRMIAGSSHDIETERVTRKSRMFFWCKLLEH